MPEGTKKVRNVKLKLTYTKPGTKRFIISAEIGSRPLYDRAS